jgi:uncharacterized membrane protein YsdA (DUF1294 family)
MPLLTLAAFAAMLAGAVLVGSLPLWVPAAYAVLSLLCFALYALDKAAARAGARRTPESTLLLLGLAGGWPGAVLAQQWLRHKSAKRSFQWRFWVTALLNAGALTWLAWEQAIMAVH